MIIKNIENFSLRQIDESGQCFRMQRIPVTSAFDHHLADTLDTECYQLIAKDKLLIAAQQGHNVYFDCSLEEYSDCWEEYFDLKRKYADYIQMINPNDHYLMEAANLAEGVRILKQDLWEMIVTFLISQQNNIKRIRKCIESICQTYGRRCEKAGIVYYAFPEASALAYLDEDELKKCNLGYRSKYVVRTARMVNDGSLNLEEIQSLPYEKAKEALLQCFGIGEKVADCICLFALHELDAFPIDTHIRQVLDRHYKRGFPNRRYKGVRGVMQQYIFYYELMNT